jgi:hypothetical protein
MNVIRTEIEDVLILEPRVFGDDRGFFYESFNQSAFEHILGYPVSFVQDNHSRSSKNVLRGLHFQRGEYAQDKLVRCTHGAVLIFDPIRYPLVNGLVFCFQLIISSSCGYQKGLLMAFWFCLISLNFNIKLQTIIILKAIVEYVGMMNALQLIGPKHQG